MMSSNIIHAKFKNSVTEELMIALRKEIMLTKYDEVSISELLGILELLKIEFIERLEK
jgi:hypothetical protein